MMLKQLLSFVLGLIFVAVTALQYQGPDAPLWIGVFLSAAMLHFATALERTYSFVLWVAFIGYLVIAYFYWPGDGVLAQGLVANDSAMRFWALVGAAATILLQALLLKKRTGLHPPHLPGHVTGITKKWAN